MIHRKGNICTVEPPNKGHIGTKSFVLYRGVSFIRRLKCTGMIEVGTSRFVLYREVFFIRSVLLSEVPLYTAQLLKVYTVHIGQTWQCW